MKIIASHLSMIWLVLQATPVSVRGGSLRGLSSFKYATSVTVNSSNKTISYTVDADFDRGSLINVNHAAVKDQLQLDNNPKPFNIIWVACSARSTVVKVDTISGNILGEYFTVPYDAPNWGNPSRTTVDPDGSVWVANRNNVGPHGKGTIVHIGLLENNQCENRNGKPGIQTSTGLGDIKPWADMSGTRHVSTAQDECIVHYTEVNSEGTRHLSIDSEKNVWVSGSEVRNFDKVKGGRWDVSGSGSILKSFASVGYGGYGGLIDGNGFLWSAGEGNNFLRWDVSRPLTKDKNGDPDQDENGDGPNIGPLKKGFNRAGQTKFNSYGLCKDKFGNVWNTEYGPMIHKYSADGVHLGEYEHGGALAQGCVAGSNGDIWVAHSKDGSSTVGHIYNNGTRAGTGIVQVGSGPTGVAVDGVGKIWVTNFNDDTLSRIDPSKNNGIGIVDKTVKLTKGDQTTCSPYNYGDMTGSTNSAVPNTGSWAVIYDHGSNRTDWGTIQWNALTPGDSSLTVQVKNNAGDPWKPVLNGQKLSGLSGQLLHVQVSFTRATAKKPLIGESPSLKDLSIVLPTTSTCPDGGDAEVWVGHHSVQTEAQHFDQAKIWVISSNPVHHNKLPGIFMPLNETWVPTGYKGIRNCARIYSIGAGDVAVKNTPSKKLAGAVNRPIDLSNPLHESIFVMKAEDPKAFKKKIDDANTKMNTNFLKSLLQYQAYPRTDWYTRGYGWVEFNSNGYIAGLLSYLGFTGKNATGHLFGWSKPVPVAFFTKALTTNESIKKEVYATRKCTGGKAEVWVGYHNVSTYGEQDVWVDHAKIWVISSDSNHHAKLPAGTWKELRFDRVPSDYKGDKNCAKFYTLGSGFDKMELIPIVNYRDDVDINLLGAVQVESGVDPVDLKKKIDDANKHLKENFVKTSLKRESAFPRDWNYWGWGWNEFNGNGYISGLLNHLGYYGVPSSGNLPGWEKEVPTAFFENTFKSEAQVRDEIFFEHPSPYKIDIAIDAKPGQVSSTGEASLLATSPEESSQIEVTNEATQISSTGEETQQSSLDPTLSLASTLEPSPEGGAQLELTNEPSTLNPSPEEASQLELTNELPTSEPTPEEAAQLELTNEPSFLEPTPEEAAQLQLTKENLFRAKQF